MYLSQSNLQMDEPTKNSLLDSMQCTDQQKFAKLLKNRVKMLQRISILIWHSNWQT